MRVTVRLGGSLAGSGLAERPVSLPPGASVKSLMECIGPDTPFIAREPGTSTPGSRAPIILLNGRAIGFLDGLETALKDGDVVAIFPAIDGG